MSIILLGDTHFGASNSNPNLHDYMEKFYKDFFEYIDANNIKTIIQLGDLFDVRKHINTWSLAFFRQVFLKPVIERNLKVYVLVGNHDIYYRESLKISSVEEVLEPYADWFTIVNEPKDYVIEDHSFLLVPWVCKDNISTVQGAIERSSSTFCAGHFEFNGFELFRGQLAKTNYTHESYSKFKKVFSGHFHHMSSRDNVLYTGTPYELTWQDCNTTKGFYVLHSDESLELVENQHTLFSSFALSEQEIIPESLVSQKHVRIRVDLPLEPKDRDRLLDRLYSMKPYSLKLVEKKVETEGSDEVTYAPTTSITDLIGDYVNNISIPETLEKDRLKSVLLGMLIEATNAN